jgi:speckle-type POZ protein
LLESSDFLKNDCLKINCTVGVVISATDCPQLNSIHVPESDIGSHFGTLLENMEGSDVTFDVAGEKFPGHKLVLAARSPEFRSKFFNGTDMEDKQEIVVTDLEPKVFKVKTIYLLFLLPPFHYLLSLEALITVRIYSLLLCAFSAA